MQFVAKTLFGLEEVLCKELHDMGAANVIKSVRAVSFEGDREIMYRANYNLRTALSILRQVESFRVKTAKDLYRMASRIDWTAYMKIEQTFAVVPVVHSDLFTHTGYAALVLKDAIADSFRSVYSRRPSVDTRNPDIVFNLRISGKDVIISLDSSVVPLFKRGYRLESTRAPINEVLAAGIIKLSGWTGETNFLDPMCGSGTFAIEAAMMAMGMPPGKNREFYGFMKWPDYDADLFRKVRQNSVADEKRDHIPVVACYDKSEIAVRKARKNIGKAGLYSFVSSGCRDFFESESGGNNYTIIMNPPYGERLSENDIREFYSRIGERLKHGYSGSQAWIISSSTEGLKSIGLKPGASHKLFNGALESKLVAFDLFKGKRKAKF